VIFIDLFKKKGEPDYSNSPLTIY